MRIVPARLRAPGLPALERFLGDTSRPAETLTFHELQGFLFAIASSPDTVPPSEWLPMIGNDESLNFADEAEAERILGLAMNLYNEINLAVLERRNALPRDCAFHDDLWANFDDDASISQCAKGCYSGSRIRLDGMKKGIVMGRNDTSGYVLGHAEGELQRLAMQSQYWSEVTMEVLQKSGLEPGMRVLDVGCGAGDVSLMAAGLVGPSGAVLGVDRSPEAVQSARARAASLDVGQASFDVADIDDIDPALRFDAVIGRLVLMYMTDPAATLRQLVRQLGPGGIVAFIEMDMRVARSVPSVPGIETVLRWVRQTFERAGASLDLGPQLWKVFRDAGLPEPALVVCQKLDPPTSAAGTEMLSGIVRSLAPMMEKFGVATRAEIRIEVLQRELHEAQSNCGAAFLTPCIVGACSRTM